VFEGRYKAIPVDSQDPAYFRTASEYIHLNPHRAGLLDAVRPRLGAYRWSSYRAFVGAQPLPEWLVRKRVFQAHELPDESAASRRRFAAFMARRMMEVSGGEESEQQRAAWSDVRREWVMGSASFREQLQGLVGRAIKGRRRESYVGETPLRVHDRVEAERISERVERAWTIRDWAERPANDPRKQVLAWLLRSRTTVGGAWIAARLAMGHVSNVSRAYRAAQPKTPPRPLNQLKSEVMHICKD
jgi:hypothetical protein